MKAAGRVAPREPDQAWVHPPAESDVAAEVWDGPEPPVQAVSAAEWVAARLAAEDVAHRPADEWVIRG